MWAARLLGYREFSLSDLVQRHLGVVLEKGPQKMNWALRPLSERMSTYALNDTRYLQPLAEILRGELQTKGRSPWLEEACVRVVSEAARGRQLDPDNVWRVKGSDRLAPPAMALVRELWRWREEEARAVNKPPYFILSHENLVALSDAVSRGRPTRNLIPHHVPAKRVDRLRLAIQRGLDVPASEYPQPRRSAGVRLTRAEQGQFDELKRTRDASADQHGLDPTVIASKADLVGLAKDRANGVELMNWQRQLLELK
jgi:ribonuclease D